jgi:hypothetical protein
MINILKVSFGVIYLTHMILGLGSQSAFSQEVRRTCKERTSKASQITQFAKILGENFNNPKDFDVNKEENFFYPLNPETLNKGHVQLYTTIKELPKFKEKYQKLVDLDAQFEKVLDKDNFDYVFAGRQAYLVKGVETGAFGVGLYLDPKFREMAYTKTKYIFPENMPPEFNWIVVQEIPSVGGGDVISKVKYTKYDINGMTPKQLEVIDDLEEHLLLPEYFVVSSLKQPGTPSSSSSASFGIGSDHKYFKGSVSFTSYYRVGPELKDTLVITYQMAAIKKPMLLPGFIMEKASGAFAGGTQDTITGMRKYFETK